MHSSALELGRKRVELNVRESFKYFTQELLCKYLKKNICKGLLAIAKLKPLSLFISRLLMLRKALDNVKKEKWKVKVVSALQ